MRLQLLECFCSAPPQLEDIKSNPYRRMQERLGLAAEHGFFFRAAGAGEWEARFGEADDQAAWKEMTRPILELYTESTDGSNIEAKDSALVRRCRVAAWLVCGLWHWAVWLCGRARGLWHHGRATSLYAHAFGHLCV